MSVLDSHVDEAVPLQSCCDSALSSARSHWHLVADHSRQILIADVPTQLISTTHCLSAMFMESTDSRYRKALLGYYDISWWHSQGLKTCTLVSKGCIVLGAFVNNVVLRNTLVYVFIAEIILKMLILYYIILCTL